MISLIQFPYSPYCIVQRRLLEYSGARFKLVNVPNADRSLVWKLTKERYYQVPVLQDGRTILFETEEDSQVIAKYLDERFKLGLFPAEWEGIQTLLWRHFEGEVESFTFKINDTHWRDVVPKRERLGFVRHKERKFGRGCLERWEAEKPALYAGLAAALQPAENMLATRPFLLTDRPLFSDFCLFGMLGNLLYSGQESIPASCPRLVEWYQRMDAVQRPSEAPSKKRG